MKDLLKESLSVFAGTIILLSGISGTAVLIWIVCKYCFG